ncbi:MAG TPA: hypothetical protein DDZ61_22275 [Aeromonas salmonicida]|nr:hypothetical protein [Aeromonas salmonicida]HBL05277.1 hypothetical protein [Aeromonas salmonicida]
MKPDLTGTWIVLCTICLQDAADLFEIYGNPLTMESASDPCFTSPTMVVQMMASVVRLEQTGESLEWAIVERESNKVIGTCGLHSFRNKNWDTHYLDSRLVWQGGCPLPIQLSPPPRGFSPARR